MKRSFRGNLKAVAPVIATIIIVAIAIVMSIAVAYWMLGLGAAFTRYEKLEFTSGYAVYNATSQKFDIRITLKNTGSADATIDVVFLNAKPSADYALAPYTTSLLVNSTVFIPAGFIGKTLTPGDSTGVVVISVYRNGDGGRTTVWKSGMSVELMIQTVAGKQYPKVIVFP